MTTTLTLPPVRSPPDRIILGIDPGIAITGYAVLAVKPDTFTLLACDVLRTRAELTLSDRLSSLYERLTQLLVRYCPHEAAVESLFFGRNSSSALKVAHARGVLLLALNHAKLPITEYTPSQVKRVVTGYGNATKAQVGEQVRTLAHLSTVPRPDDAADAVAVALCHVFVNVRKETLWQNTH